MNGPKVRDGLQLDDNLALDEQVKTISTVDSYAFVQDRQSLLTLHMQVTLRQLVRQASLVGGFEQAGTERTVHGYRGPDDLFRNFMKFHLCALCGLRGEICRVYQPADGLGSGENRTSAGRIKRT